MGDEAISLFKCALVQQELNALAGRHLSFFVLALAALGASALLGSLVAPAEFVYAVHPDHCTAGVSGAPQAMLVADAHRGAGGAAGFGQVQLPGADWRGRTVLGCRPQTAGG